MTEKLNTGDTFPAMTIPLVGGGAFELPVGMRSKYLVVLFYRGHW